MYPMEKSLIEVKISSVLEGVGVNFSPDRVKFRYSPV